MSFKADIGKYVYKTANSVLVCCKCHSQVVISGTTDNHNKRIYKCDKDTCPSFGKERNRIQVEWIEYDQIFSCQITKVI